MYVKGLGYGTARLSNGQLDGYGACWGDEETTRPARDAGKHWWVQQQRLYCVYREEISSTSTIFTGEARTGPGDSESDQRWADNCKHVAGRLSCSRDSIGTDSPWALAVYDIYASEMSALTNAGVCKPRCWIAIVEGNQIRIQKYVDRVGN